MVASLVYGESSVEMIPVEPQQLYDKIAESDSMVIQEAPVRNSKILYQSTSPEALRSFSECLVLNKPKPEDYFHCMCIGEPAVYFYKNGIETVHLTNHHGRSIRCSLWTSDVLIANVDQWVEWFDNHGISSIREEVAYAESLAEKNKINWEKWMNAMPESIKPVWEDAIGNFGMIDADPLINAPRTTKRITSRTMLVTR